MNENTVIEYESSIGKLTFAYDSPFWITEIDGASGIDIDVSESRSNEQIGSSVSSQSVKPRVITLDGAIFDPVVDNRKRLLNIIAPQIAATLTVVENGESWYLDVIPEKTPEIESGNGVQHFQARLHAAYPYWRSTKSYSNQIAGLISRFRFPFNTGGTWCLSEFSQNFFSTIVNNGNVPIEFKVTFTARSALSNPELYHMDTGKRIYLRKNMLAGDAIVVSTIYGSKGVVCKNADGTVTNGFRYLSVDSDLSMTLVPGANLLRIGADTNREGLGARIDAPEGVKSGV